ncbi:MAG TPA: response regulator [Myxococcales bacterium]|nr:response regulator [Myxococcales bacterium]
MPQRIGRYEVLAPLSVGGMAELYLAYTAGPAGFRKFVALKKILPDAARDEEAVRMFIDEARLTASMSHSNIAQVYDLGEDHGDLYIAMEFIPGLDMARVSRSFRRRGLRLPLGLAALVVREACLALHYAHHYQDPTGRSGGIIHRDISPKNLMLTYSGNVKVIDFGIALALNRLSSEGAVRGTAAYMAPEQIQSRPLDARTDLFAVGIVLHELLVGQKLFQGDTNVNVLKAVLGGAILPPDQLNPRVPSELSAVAMKALERDPDDRYASGKEMARAIESAAGALMFDDERAASFMAEMFSERLANIRSLLDLAAPEGDEAQLRSAAAELRADSIRLSSGTYTVPEAEAMEQSPDALQDAQEPVSQDTDTFRKIRRILAVDDDQVMTTFLRMALGPFGYDVVGCHSSNRVMEAIQAEQPDLILLDVRMPEKDGYQVCREIREQKKDRYIPIIFLSGACSLDERVKGLTVGADDFVKKPFEAPELAARIRAHIKRVATLRASAVHEAMQASQPPGGGARP